MFLLKYRTKDTAGGTSSTSVTNTEEMRDQDTNIDADSTKNQDDKNTKSSSFNSPNEKSRLTDSMAMKTTQKQDKTEDVRFKLDSSKYGHVCGWEIMKITDFWLLAIMFTLGTAVNKLVAVNVGTYLRSFRQEDHLHLIMTTAPWILVVVKIIVGTVSDLYREKIPRIFFRGNVCCN